ncbi:hypothetical protein HNY73_016281 [Argiope bruennichi]|uniref:Uncharacterized protein n=1 Tax=Argiope bruennichi TaxID=94029 RepID=A0A8T0EIE9_ARGBR|nr:hypothetical protein HNY73_016281 [Argiope bruennichi]
MGTRAEEANGENSMRGPQGCRLQRQKTKSARATKVKSVKKSRTNLAKTTLPQRVAPDEPPWKESGTGEAEEGTRFRWEQEETPAIRPQRTVRVDLNLAAFQYDVNYDYSLHPSVNICKIDKACGHCSSLKFNKGTPGMCCGMAKLNCRHCIHNLLSGDSLDFKRFLQNIRKYNSAFQMKSFGVDKVFQDQYMPTFKIQGQIYHRVDSSLPVSDAVLKFLQIYFMGDDDAQVDQRCDAVPNTKSHIIFYLQTFFHQGINKLFKTSIDYLPVEKYAIQIPADKRQLDQHPGRYNAPTVNEVAIVIIGEERDIILQRRNNTIQLVSESHRSYDALQYPKIL